MEITDDAAILHLSDTIEDQGTILGDPCYRNMDVIMEMQELQQQVNNLLATLPPREKEVLRLLYGMNLRRSYTVSEVAKILRISKVRVCQMRDRALERMHAPGAIQRR
jgi:RNA polymerase primary sigma factor